MRKVGSLANRHEAQLFRWYLQSQGVEAWLDEEDSEQTLVWVLADDQLERAKEALIHFEEQKQLEGLHQQAETARKAYEQAHKRQQESPKARKRPAKSGLLSLYPITLFLIATASLIFLFQYQDKLRILYHLLAFSQFPARVADGALAFKEIRQGELWRLITPIFLHQGVFHILFNMMWLYQLGSLVEGVLRPRSYLFLILLIAIFSHTAFYLVAGPAFGGMSGVVYGLFGYLWLMERYQPQSGLRLEGHLGQFFLFWYGICLVLSLLGMGVANTIHGVGALVGLGFAYGQTGAYRHFFKQLARNKEFRRSIGLGLLLLVAGLLVDHFSY